MMMARYDSRVNKEVGSSRDWYIGCAQPSQGCETGSTPVSRFFVCLVLWFYLNRGVDDGYQKATSYE